MTFFRIALICFLIISVFSISFNNTGALASPGSIQVAIDTEQNRFTKVVLAEKLKEPMQFQLLKARRVLFGERNYNCSDSGEHKIC